MNIATLRAGADRLPRVVRISNCHGVGTPIVFLDWWMSRIMSAFGKLSYKTTTAGASLAELIAYVGLRHQLPHCQQSVERGLAENSGTPTIRRT